jgi:hypothetical protein
LETSHVFERVPEQNCPVLCPMEWFHSVYSIPPHPRILQFGLDRFLFALPGYSMGYPRDSQDGR